MNEEVSISQELHNYEAIPFYIGHHEHPREYEVTEEVFQHAEDLGYDYLTHRITNSNYHARVSEAMLSYMRHSIDMPSAPPFPTLSPLTGRETDISPTPNTSRMLHIVSPWIDLTSPMPLIADVSKQVFQQEIAYALFCGASNVLLCGPSVGKSSSSVAQLTAAIRGALKRTLPSLVLTILLPMTPGSDENNPALGGDFEIDLASLALKEMNSNASPRLQGDELSIWDIWHVLRNACKYDFRLTAALVIPKRLPPAYVQSRWHSEPIRLLSLPSSSFTPNKYNVDVLTPNHQQLIARFMRSKNPPWLLLSGVGVLPGLFGQNKSPKLHAGPATCETKSHTDSNAQSSTELGKPTVAEINFATLLPHQITPHLMYLREHIQRHQPVRNQLERYGAGYQDWPQSPLQPLADNLDSATYEVFEKDPVKYAWYECAVRIALEEIRKKRQVSGKVVVAVVGAGRGPLVQRVLQASTTTGIDIECIALEKNPSAFVHLQKRNQFEWHEQVTLVQGDMRCWEGFDNSEGDRKWIHILISELLGSLADNELSPECLDGVQHLLHPSHGVSIPSSYTAFATPVSAPELWRSIKHRTNQGAEGNKHDPLMLPYVSWLHSIDYMSKLSASRTTSEDGSLPKGEDHKQGADPIVQELWHFHHPLYQDHLRSETAKANRHNERSAHLTFPIARRGVCHGIAGYFEAVLYDRNIESPDSEAHETMPITFEIQAGQPYPKNPNRPVISTNPLIMSKESPEMISWFPLFFPFKTPMYVPDKGEIAIDIWRKTDKRRVWYEWSAEVFGPSGKCGESGWHTSESAACLM